MTIPRHKSLGIAPTIYRIPTKPLVIGDGSKRKPRPIIKRKPPPPKWSR